MGLLIHILSRASERLLVWCICRDAERTGADLRLVRRITNLEIRALRRAPQEVIAHDDAERRIVGERLARRFDPGMAMNELTERARQHKRDAREFANGLTDNQLRALEFQQAYLKRIADAS